MKKARLFYIRFQVLIVPLTKRCKIQLPVLLFLPSCFFIDALKMDIDPLLTCFEESIILSSILKISCFDPN